MSSLSQRICDYYDRWVIEYEGEYAKSTLSYAPLNISPQLFYVATFF